MTNREILFRRTDHQKVVGYSDVDWAEDPNDKKITIGYCCFFKRKYNILEQQEAAYGCTV